MPMMSKALNAVGQFQDIRIGVRAEYLANVSQVTRDRNEAMSLIHAESTARARQNGVAAVQPMPLESQQHHSGCGHR